MMRHAAFTSTSGEAVASAPHLERTGRSAVAAVRARGYDIRLPYTYRKRIHLCSYRIDSRGRVAVASSMRTWRVSLGPLYIVLYENYIIL